MVWMVVRHDFIDAFCVAIFIDLYFERLQGDREGPRVGFVGGAAPHPGQAQGPHYSTPLPPVPTFRRAPP